MYCWNTTTRFGREINSSLNVTHHVLPQLMRHIRAYRGDQSTMVCVPSRTILDPNYINRPAGQRIFQQTEEQAYTAQVLTDENFRLRQMILELRARLSTISREL